MTKVSSVDRQCHYCPRPAVQMSTIVARPYRRTGVPNVTNRVPACARCAALKGNAVTACRCRRCKTARSLLVTARLPGIGGPATVDVAAEAQSQDVAAGVLDPEVDFRQSVTDAGRRWFFDSGGISVLVLRDGPLCHYCGERRRLTVEHVVPRSLGGPWWFDNLVAACAPCNTGRGSSNADHAGCAFCAAARQQYPATTAAG